MTTRTRGLKLRTKQGMVVLTATEAGELRDRLAGAATTQPASETMAVSANASTNVTFTTIEKAAVLEVLSHWHEDQPGRRTRLAESARGAHRGSPRRIGPTTRRVSRKDLGVLRHLNPPG